MVFALKFTIKLFKQNFLLNQVAKIYYLRVHFKTKAHFKPFKNEKWNSFTLSKFIELADKFIGLGFKLRKLPGLVFFL